MEQWDLKALPAEEKGCRIFWEIFSSPVHFCQPVCSLTAGKASPCLSPVEPQPKRYGFCLPLWWLCFPFFLSAAGKRKNKEFGLYLQTWKDHGSEWSRSSSTSLCRENLGRLFQQISTLPLPQSWTKWTHWLFLPVFELVVAGQMDNRVTSFGRTFNVI